MSFMWMQMLWGLLVVPLLIAAYIYMQRRRQRYAVRYASLSLVREAVGRGPGIRRHIPAAIFLLGLTAMILAIARPMATVTLPSQQGTVILTLDVSGSMRATDLKPNRMEAAKAAAKAFVEQQPQNVRIGVVSFSGDASVVQAPTTDRKAVQAAIDRLTPQRSTAIGTGLVTSLDAISQEGNDPNPTPATRDPLVLAQPTPAPTPVPTGTHIPAVIVLLSDGQSNTGISPSLAVKQAEDRGVRVYTVGVGSPEGAVIGAEGRSVRVRLDEATLQKIAEATDGRYYRANTETDLREIYENLGSSLIFKTEQTEITAGFTAFAALLMIVAGGLSLLWFNRLP